MNLTAQFLKVITDKFGVIETREATPMDAVVLRDLRPDSLDVIELALDLEDAFHCEITEDAMIELGEKATLRDVFALVSGTA